MRSVLRALVPVLALAPAVHAAQSARDAVVEEVTSQLRAASGGEVRVTQSRETDLAVGMSLPRGGEIPVAGRTVVERARAFLNRFGSAFGVRGDAESLAAVRVRERDHVGMSHVRLQQLHKGVPVTGAQIMVHLRGSGVASVLGKTVADLDLVDMRARVGSAEARDQARRAVARAARGGEFTLGEPRLEILNRGLLENRKGIKSRLAWHVEANGFQVREHVWVDARTGQTLLRFSQLTDAKERTIYDGQSGPLLPGIKIRKEGAPALGDPDADLAYDYLGDTYDYFFDMFGRDSWDGLGAPLKATVRHCPSPASCPYQNAFWNGKQMVFGAGFSAADDVDGHELTHAVTDAEAGLFYYMQSGALNESFSDIFGESIDLLNGSGTDDPGSRWLLGEDVPGFGALRNMMDPSAFGDPTKMSDVMACDQAPFYQDQGGVHQNSGIPNHAYALMVDGGTFNGETVTGIGLDKAARIQYRVLTQYLNTASDFLEYHNAVLNACEDLVGQNGIASSDCVEVEKALEAVEMSDAVNCLPAPPTEAEYCPAGQAPRNVFLDTMDNPKAWRRYGLGGSWFTKNAPIGTFASSGEQALWGYDAPVIGVAGVEMKGYVPLPPNSFARFNHSFGFDNWLGTAYDGGIVTLNDSFSFFDAGSLIDSGAGYNATLSGCCSNPYAGLSAFSYASWGYTSTRLDLSSAPANTKVKFGFQIATDDGFDDYGWFIDDLQIYTCDTAPTISILDLAKLETKKPKNKFNFKVTLSRASGAPVTVRYRTSDVSATGGVDYTPTTGILVFPPGTKTLAANVNVIGDQIHEPNETFEVELEDIEGALPGDVEAVGTILTDE
jgi:Zn-dependent metalloprotease